MRPESPRLTRTHTASYEADGSSTGSVRGPTQNSVTTRAFCWSHFNLSHLGVVSYQLPDMH